MVNSVRNNQHPILVTCVLEDAEITHIIGSGGMCRVKLAQHRRATSSRHMSTASNPSKRLRASASEFRGDAPAGKGYMQHKGRNCHGDSGKKWNDG